MIVYLYFCNSGCMLCCVACFVLVFIQSAYFNHTSQTIPKAKILVGNDNFDNAR